MVDYEKVKQPVYKIKCPKGFFGPNTVLYQEGAILGYTGEPNEDMVPLNELARTAMKKYLDKLDTLAREKAEKDGKPFTRRPRGFIEQVDEFYDNGSGIFEIREDKPVPLMAKPKEDMSNVIQEIKEENDVPVVAKIKLKNQQVA